MQKHQPNPDLCFYEDRLGLEACPFSLLSYDSRLPAIYNFCAMSIEKYEESGVGNQNIQLKKTKYSVSIEKFEFACRLFQVHGSNVMEAFDWASLVARAATEAREMAILNQRKRRFKKRIK